VWSQFVKVLSLSGEFGFYVDEYDAGDNWISGQWKGMVPNGFSNTHIINYVPSSLGVNKVRLQYYVTLGSTAEILLDSISLTQN
jgi:hypothetical protein